MTDCKWALKLDFECDKCGEKFSVVIEDPGSPDYACNCDVVSDHPCVVRQEYVDYFTTKCAKCDNWCQTREWQDGKVEGGEFIADE